MKKIFLLTLILGLTACNKDEGCYVASVQGYYDQPMMIQECGTDPNMQVQNFAPSQIPENFVPCNSPDCSGALFASPNGNDLLLETKHHIIHMEGVPNKEYTYRVWTGDNTQEPNLIIENGVGAILIEQ